MQDTEFTTSNNVFNELIKFLRRAGRDKTGHHAVITNEDLVVLRKLEAMNPNTPGGLPGSTSSYILGEEEMRV